MRSNIVAAVAAIAMLAAGTPAIAQSAAPLSIAPAVQAGESTEGSSRLGGGPWFPPVLFGLIVLGGVLMATGVLFDDDDDPVSA